MVGTLVNTAAVVVGSGIGLVFKKSLPEKYQTIYFQAVGLFTLLLGVKMSLGISSPLLVVLSLVLGGFLGLKMRLNERTEQLGDYIKTQTKSKNDRFTEGLVTGFLLFCMGSMTIVGAIEEGFGQTSDLLLTKSIMDFFSSIMLASGLGIGVLFSAVLLLVFQGGITLLVSIIGKDIPSEIITEITVVGGIILIGLSINLLKIKKIEVINLLPALLFICLFVWLNLWMNL
ncbi:membrane protein [Bacteroidia bacterium]|nr:membrane protein [Bacteroidia bacterium]